MKKGPRRRTNNNQKAAGAVKIRCGRRTFHKTNGPITVPTLTVRRHDNTTKPADPIFLMAEGRPTDQERLADYMATAMDQIPVNIHGHRLHYSTIMQALEAHATTAHQQAMDAIARHDINAASAQAIGFNDP